MSKFEECVQMIEAELRAADGRMSSKTIVRRLKYNGGFSIGTINKAKAHLAVRSEPVYEKPGCTPTAWEWVAP